jgi:hypothetical protein
MTQMKLSAVTPGAPAIFYRHFRRSRIHRLVLTRKAVGKSATAGEFSSLDWSPSRPSLLSNANSAISGEASVVSLMHR